MLLLLGCICLVMILVVCAIGEIFWPTTIVAAIVIFWAWAMGVKLLPLLLLNWFYIPIYFVLAVVWVFFQWTRYIEKSLKQQKRDLKIYANKTIDIPKWENKWIDFTGKFFWWPLDLLAYILRDVLEDVWEWTAKLISKAFNRYAEWRFRSLMGDQS